METQEILTYFINFVLLSSILFFLIDLSLFLVNSWYQLNPSVQPNFYHAVKDLLWDEDIQLGISTRTLAKIFCGIIISFTFLSIEHEILASY